MLANKRYRGFWVNRLDRNTVQAGFTLIEVLVALVVAAVAIAALSRALGMNVSHQTLLEQKIVATWVAQDQLLKRQLFPQVQVETTVSSLGREWQVDLKLEPSLVPGYQQAYLNVFLSDSSNVSASNAEKSGVASLASIVRVQETP